MKSENPLMKYPRNDGCDFKSHPQPKFGSSEILSILAVFIVHREGGGRNFVPFNPLDFRGRPNTKFVQRFQKWIRSPFPQNRGKLIWHGRHLKSVQIWTDSRSGEQRGVKFRPPLDGADLSTPPKIGEQKRTAPVLLTLRRSRCTKIPGR